MEELKTSLGILRKQENGYVAKDWLAMNDPADDVAVDAECRTLMVQWFYNMSPCCNITGEVVEITLSLVDRYLSTPQAAPERACRSSFQLVCLTALYLAAKIHNQIALAPNLVARFSEGVYSGQDITNMEKQMLQALNWRVHPPTCCAYLGHLMQLVPQSTRGLVWDLAALQCEAALINSYFVPVPKSKIVYASIMNALRTNWHQPEQ